jgi:CO dehydrogenase/acetyl-CoA synthase beta subunit
VKKTFRLRAKMISALRRMLDDRGFLEIEVRDEEEEEEEEEEKEKEEEEA